MKTATVSALALSCLTGHGLTAPTTFSGPPDVVRRSASWVVEGRHASSLDQAQIEQIGNDIKSNLSSTIQLMTLVSQEEPVVNPPFMQTIAVLQGIMQSVGGALASLARMKGMKG